MTPYRDAAPIYRDAGWGGVLPLPPGRKDAPPKGYTGWNGKDPTSKMIEMWCNETVGEYQAASNIAIHTPGGVVGIDVDHYGNKTGGDTLGKLEAELGPLPKTWKSGSRPGISGIYWYRVEPGLRWPTGPGKDIEFIHTGHRYAVVAPSIHPNGARYGWWDPDGNMPEGLEVPTDDELPWIPDEWQIRFTAGVLRGGEPEHRPATEQERATCLTEGEPCQATAKAAAKYQDRTVAAARHDSMIQTVMALIRLGEQGHQGVMSALMQLHKRFTEEVKPDRIDGSEQGEFQRAVNGAIAKVSQSPTAAGKRGCCGESSQLTQVGKLNLPAEFWTSRPVLQHIRQAAHSKGRSADAVLYATLAKLSAMLPPRLRFENCLGEGSFNLFVAIIGKSGRGKSTGVSLAKTLIHTPPSLTSPAKFRDAIGIGSGEGLAELDMGVVHRETGEVYGPKAKKAGQKITVPERAKVRDNAFVYIDEGQTLNQQGKRQGNIVLPTIRSAFNGETLGQSNARAETTRHVPAGSYSLGMVIGYQKETAQEVLADVYAGTPQRLIWTAAIDPTVPLLERPEHPGPLDLDLDSIAAKLDGTKITFCPEISTELWAQNHAKVTGAEEDDAELDSHEPLMLAKLSALLCMLDHRAEVNPDDWALAKTMFATSRAVMDDLIEYGKEKAQAKADASADAHVTREARAHHAKTQVAGNVARIAQWIYTYTGDQGGVVTVGDAKRQAAGRDRGLFHDGLEHAAAQKWLTTDGKKIAIGLEKPS